jgi:hypothetical protein
MFESKLPLTPTLAGTPSNMFGVATGTAAVGSCIKGVGVSRSAAAGGAPSKAGFNKSIDKPIALR